MSTEQATISSGQQQLLMQHQLQQMQRQQQQLNAFIVTEQDNMTYNTDQDVELLDRGMRMNRTEVVPKSDPFDWFVLALCSCFCFPWTGMCALYYACRANRGVDFNIKQKLQDNHTTKAKCLTITSFVLALVPIILFGIYVSEIFSLYKTAIGNVHSVKNELDEFNN